MTTSFRTRGSWEPDVRLTAAVPTGDGVGVNGERFDAAAASLRRVRVQPQCSGVLGRSGVDLDSEVVIAVDVEAECPCAAIERLAAAPPVALLLAWLGLWAEWVLGVTDVVLKAVARRLANRLLPVLA
jgi:hypothetical protein